MPFWSYSFETATKRHLKGEWQGSIRDTLLIPTSSTRAFIPDRAVHVRVLRLPSLRDHSLHVYYVDENLPRLGVDRERVVEESRPDAIDAVHAEGCPAEIVPIIMEIR